MSLIAKSAAVALALAFAPAVANAEIAPRTADKCDSYICFRVTGDANGWTATVNRISNEITSTGVEGPNGQGGASRDPILKVNGRGAGTVHGFGFQNFTQKSHISFKVCEPGTWICV